MYNKYGDYDPNGLLYVLKKDADRIRENAIHNFMQPVPQPYEEVRPLVIRANAGDKVIITFSHSLNRALSIHVQGLSYDVDTSDGANVGFNKDSTTRHCITYTWHTRHEGVYLFHDMGDTRSSEDATNIHGLFGAIIVEAAESKWLDPQTGKELESGLFADIYHPVHPAFREYAVFFHDELEIKNKDGETPVDPHTGLPSSTTGISYRAEPMRNRHPLTDDHADSGEDISMSSWVYGDPAPPILRAYAGDPSKIRLIHGGIKETHVFHLHNHQWRLDGNNPDSTIIDSITISPQECYTLDILHLEESPFQMKTRTDIAGYHIHLVKFDTIVSDGATNGWNNIAGARKYETLIERFFANTELNTVFFHDHLFANSHQQHGVFGALIIEEAGATFHDIRTGKALKYGTKAVIRRKDGSSFREFALFVHDFALLFDKNGNPLNPPAVPGSHDDLGVMGINYRCEPMRERLASKEDPAYLFSSLVHGDPATPILETYPGDEIVIRQLDGAHEEQHSFNLTGMSWKKEINVPSSPDVASQTIGISEVFNIRITRPYRPGDYLYYFGGMDDACLDYGESYELIPIPANVSNHFAKAKTD